jgi:hypothetical protein
LFSVRDGVTQDCHLALSLDERFGLLVDREGEARNNRRLALRLKAASDMSIRSSLNANFTFGQTASLRGGHMLPRGGSP